MKLQVVVDMKQQRVREVSGDGAQKFKCIGVVSRIRSEQKTVSPPLKRLLVMESAKPQAKSIEELENQL